MSNWSRPSDPLELRELQRDTGPDGGPDSRWYAVAFLAGLMLVSVLGLGTNLFDSGPSELDVSSAHREGIDRGTVEAERYWEETLEEAWWESYLKGKSEGTSLSSTLILAVHDGFSWESGFETGLQSPDIDLDQRFRSGWMAGYSQAWTQVTGVTPSSPESRYAELASRIAWEGEP